MDAALFITICAMTVIAAVAAGLWARSRTPRPVVAGVGLVLVPLGLYLSGLMHLLYNGVISLVDWANRTVWDQTMSWGVGLLAGGVVLLVIAALLPRSTRRRERTAVAERTGETPAVTGTGPATTAAPASAGSRDAAAPKAGGKAVDPEDAEIEALLRKRGIM